MKTILLVLCSFAAFGQAEKLEIKIDKYVKQSMYGKQVQLIGVGIAASSLVMPKGNHLKFVGAAFIAAGVAIDLDALRQLRINPKKKRARK